MGKAQAECGAAHAAPTATNDDVESPSAVANSARVVAVVAALHSRSSFVALIPAGCRLAGGGKYRRGPPSIRCIHPPDFAVVSDCTRIHSTHPSPNTRHQSGFLQIGHG
jgi:hypothetical protein